MGSINKKMFQSYNYKSLDYGLKLFSLDSEGLNKIFLIVIKF
jgi:hypothetical protein